MIVKDAGKFNKRIELQAETITKNENGFPVRAYTTVLTCWAEVKTTKGFTLIANNSDFEKAFTRFTIRYPAKTAINRDMRILFAGKQYTIEYINDLDEAHVLVEIQAKEITH